MKQLHFLPAGWRLLILVPLPYVVRMANKKSIEEITREIETGKGQLIKGEENYVLGDGKKRSLLKTYYLMPGFIRSMIWKLMLRNPFLIKRNMGTVMITSVGMIGEFHGWIIPVSVHPLCFAVGSIVKKPVSAYSNFNEQKQLK